MKRNDRLDIPMTIDWHGKNYRGSFLLDLIQKNECKIIVEVGVKFGRTTFFLLNSLLDIKIYSIDKDISMFYNEEIKERYGERLIPIEGLSWNVADQIPDSSIDLIFIDADHSYQAVKKDIIAYTPKLKQGGIISGHDIDYPGVNEAVNELIENYDVGPNHVWFKKIKETK